MSITVTHSTPADGTFSTAGALAWNANHTLTGLGTGVETALAINVGSAGAFITNGGDAGTPSAITLTNATGLPLATGVTGTLGATLGGTGQSSWTTGDILYASAADTLAKLAAGTDGHVLTLASGVPSWAAPSGGGGTPGGSDTQIQFNDGGSFGGDSGFTFNKTTKAVTLGGATVTTSAPVLDLAQTWNNAATTFTGLKLNVTNTASNAASMLIDIQRNGQSWINIANAGNFGFPMLVGWTGVGSGYWGISGASQTAFDLFVGPAGPSSPSYGNNVRARISDAGINIGSGMRYGFASGSTANSNTADAMISRRAAANLNLGAADAAAPVAQTLSVQSVVAGTTNTAGANFTIAGSRGTGTGAGGSLVFQVAPAGSSGTAQNALDTALTITSAKEIKCAGPLWVSNAYSAGAPTATGYIVLYDSTGTAYKIPAEAV